LGTRAVHPTKKAKGKKKQKYTRRIFCSLSRFLLLLGHDLLPDLPRDGLILRSETRPSHDYSLAAWPPGRVFVIRSRNGGARFPVKNRK